MIYTLLQKKCFQNSAPRGTVLKKKKVGHGTLLKGYYFGTPRGTVFAQKRSKTVPL